MVIISVSICGQHGLPNLRLKKVSVKVFRALTKYQVEPENQAWMIYHQEQNNFEKYVITEDYSRESLRMLSLKLGAS